MSAEATRIDIFLRSNEALVRHMDDRTIAIVALENGEPSELCSGTCIRVGDKYLVATAAHLVKSCKVEDLIFVCSRVPSAVKISPVAMGFRGGDKGDAFDIAWLELSPTDALRTGKDFISLDRLVSGVSHLDQDLVLLSGYPAQLVNGELWAEKRLRVQAIGYYTTTLPTSEWPEATHPEINIVLDYPNVGNVNHDGTTIRIPEPYGVSGGGIWAARIREEGIWSPDQAVLVGIECSWYETRRVAIGIQIEHWTNMVSEDIPTLASTIAGHGAVSAVVG